MENNYKHQSPSRLSLIRFPDPFGPGCWSDRRDRARGEAVKPLTRVRPECSVQKLVG